MKKTLSDKEKDTVRGRISALLSSREDILCAYIFGSFVEENSFSDIDIGVLLSKPLIPAEALRLELALEEAISSSIRIPADVRVFNGAPVSFVYRAIKHAILIFDINPQQRADFESWILARYFDFQPFRNRYLREIGNAPL